MPAVRVAAGKSIADLQATHSDAMDKSTPGSRPSQRFGPAAPSKRARQFADADMVALTSPDRVVYPDRGTTKREVADYYLAVMDWLLPELRDRPLSVVRCPQGSERACFFQKHHAAGLERVDTVTLTEGDGDQADYLVVRDASSVMELVQFNTLEFHPWGSHADMPDMADRIVFDLDPGEGVAWHDVIAAARQIRALLERLELVSFLRTSGGKGLHVVVPLCPACTWAQVKPFAHAFADSLARSEPQRYLATATKKFRRGRIFIDYLRNGRGATSVASFSLRARPGAPVAMPIGWQELGKTSGSATFDIANTPRRLARLKRQPWEGIDALKQNLDRVGELLRGDA